LGGIRGGEGRYLHIHPARMTLRKALKMGCETNCPVEVLLVEDNLGDAKLTIEFLGVAGLPFRISVVRDGNEALLYLKKADGYEHAAMPKLILLDLRLPKRSGHEVLEAVRADPKLACIPVIILTSSDSSIDRERSLQLGANAFYTKPRNIGEWNRLTRCIAAFWSEHGLDRAC